MAEETPVDERQQVDTGPVETRSAARVADTDFGQRIITVVAVPYDEPAPIPFRGSMWNEVFTRGAFNGLSAKKRRIPASAAFEVPDKGHSNGRLVGKIVEAYPDRDEGLVTDVQIGRTELGDETLQFALDNMLGASVGFAIKSRFDQDLDSSTKTRRINRAFLHHLSFVGEPAYDGAKVLSMRSDGTLDAEPLQPTPGIDEFLEDPIFRWARERHQH